jgi:hypothetical protein
MGDANMAIIKQKQCHEEELFFGFSSEGFYT